MALLCLATTVLGQALDRLLESSAACQASPLAAPFTTLSLEDELHQVRFLHFPLYFPRFHSIFSSLRWTILCGWPTQSSCVHTQSSPQLDLI